MGHLDRISFGTDGWRDRRSAFTDERVGAVAQGFVAYLTASNTAGDRLAVGYDAREDSSAIAKTMAETFADNGYDVWLAQRDCPTPAVAAAIDAFDLAGGAMVTASHNPPEYNGIKLIPAGGAPALPAVTDTVAANLRPPDRGHPEHAGEIDRFDFVDYHVETVLDRIDATLDGLTIAYDAMHGSGRGVTDVILERAGAEVRRRRCTRAADFGGTAPEPTEEHLPGLIEAVTAGEADLGVANDGDADRVAIVTSTGFVDTNHLFAAMYDHQLASESGPAVRTVSTTFLIDRIAEANGEQAYETPVGFKWVAKRMAEVDALIGGEDSGGFTVRGHVLEKDGPLAATLVAGAHAERPLDERLGDLRERFGEIHHRSESLPCEEDRKEALLDRVVQARPEAFAGAGVVDTNDADGVKLLLEDGSWVLIRPSGTEPVMRVYAEAGTADRADRLVAEGTAFVERLQSP